MCCALVPAWTLAKLLLKHARLLLNAMPSLLLLLQELAPVWELLASRFPVAYTIAHQHGPRAETPEQQHDLEHEDDHSDSSAATEARTFTFCPLTVSWERGSGLVFLQDTGLPR